ncbi:T9SS type A sorting domain-containing protein [Hymenobacter sp. BT175]|uniref:T9SS type A sorting domain-containing protein n=1 Tax=Hymenobacter translucens TaxID=2886507 RepID=UPI001D0DD2ED|nr:T9SS type A sorting domain-containing protein [Hymenobacter translucens]MCC2546662.1 T9SS type A sorting domain-containing protein [Hymenobacter translucens]
MKNPYLKVFAAHLQRPRLFLFLLLSLLAPVTLLAQSINITPATSPSSPTNFGQVAVGNVSSPVTYTVTASGLTSAISVSFTNAPSFEGSTDNGATYTQSPSLPAAGGTLLVRFRPTAVGVTNDQYIVLTGQSGRNTIANYIDVQGEGTPGTPNINVSPASLSFGGQIVNTQSAPQSVSVSATSLTDDITVQAPAGFEISTGGGTYSNSLVISRGTGTVNTTVDVRFVPTAVQNYVGNVTFGSAGATTRNVGVSGTGQQAPPALSIQAAPGNTLPLANFGNVQVYRTSTPQSFIVNGNNLTGNVTVAAPEGFEIRTGTNAFSTNNVILVPSGTAGSGTVNTRIDVRFAPVPGTTRPDGSGTYNSNIVVSTPNGSSTVTQNVAVAGTGVAAPTGAYIFVDPSSLNFGLVSQSGSGQVLTFVVGGDNLGTTPISLVTALTGSTTSGAIQIRNPAVPGSQFTNSLTIDPVGGRVPETTIEARIVGPIPSQSDFTGTITATSGSATPSPTNVVNVTARNNFSGTNTSSTFTVSTPATATSPAGAPLNPFSTVPEKASASQSVLVSGSFLVNPIRVQAPNNFQVSLDPLFPGLGNGGTGTITGNSFNIIPQSDGTVNNVSVYIRYVPTVAGTESGTGVTFESAPATSIAAIVRATSIGTIESRTIFSPEGPIVIGTGPTAPQRIRIFAERVRNPTRISVKGESQGAIGNPNGFAQFQISRIAADGTAVGYTDQTDPNGSTISLDPNPNTNVIDEDIFVRYSPTRVGAAQSVLQYITPDVTASPANTLSPIVSSISSADANTLNGRAIDVEPTQDTPFTASRNIGASSASITFNPTPGVTGYGEFHIVLISTSPTLSVPDVMPVDGTDYNAGNGEFMGQGQSTINDSAGNTYYVVFSGGAPTATITGLDAETTYYAYVFDYNSTNLGETIFINNAENYKGPAQPTTLQGAILPGVDPPLPVELTSFTAKLRGTQVALTWTTASEKNNRGFEIQRSQDGREFQAIGFVNGKGTTSARSTYNSIDDKPLFGTSFYRLKQIDNDGKTAFSAVATVSNELGEVAMFPNPTSDVVTVRLPQGTTEGMTATVSDLTGRLLRSQKMDASGEISLRDLKSGTYVVTLKGNNQHVSQKVVKN